MIEFGTVKSVDATKATIVVEFPHLETEATCTVLVPTTGANAVYYLPSKDTQVVCWLESGKNICLGAVFSEADPVPDNVDENTQVIQFGKSKIILKSDSIYFEIEGSKATLNKDSIRFENGSISILMDDKITLNGGSNNSYMMKIDQVVSKLNRLENALNALKQVFTIWVPAPMDGGAVLKAAVTSWAAQLIQPVTMANDLKDDKIKH